MYSRILSKYCRHSIIFLSVFLIFVSCSEKKKTAQEYYYELLPDKSFASYIPDSAELKRINQRNI